MVLWRKKSLTVVVYQMGKVASSTIAQSLSSQRGFDVIHTHHLVPAYADSLNSRKRSLGWRVTVDPHDVRELSSRLLRLKNLKVICLVREPVGRNVSAFFQNLDEIYGIENAHESLSIEQLLDGFMNCYPHEIPLEWFDRELGTALQVDVFAETFPVSRGYQLISLDNLGELLLMRHDLDDAMKSRQIGAFLGLGKMRLVQSNIGQQKPYQKIYRQFLEHAIIPAAYIDSMLGSKYARHFYSDDALENIRRFWLTNRTIG